MLQIKNMDYNVVKSIRDTTVASITEPVTAAELKDYLRLEGFTAVGGAELSFTSDDTLIGIMITAVREQFEKITGLTLTANRTKAIVLTNLCGGIEIPCGPVKAVDTITDADDTDISTSMTLTGNQWKYLDEPKYENMKLTITCGYGSTGVDTLPASIKLDLMRAAAYYYMNRGDDQAVNRFISQLAIKYTRNTAIV